MEKEPRFLGRKYADAEKAEVKQVLSEWAKEAALPMVGELEKTPEDIRMISLANQLIEDELDALGIEGYVPVSPERIHFFKSQGQSVDGDHGTSSSVESKVIVDRKEANTDARLLAVLVHELVHQASTELFYVDQEGAVYDARVGYRIRSPWKTPMERRALTGFNEIMVETTVRGMLQRNHRLIQETVGITAEELQGPIYHYQQYVPLLAKIVSGIAKHKNVPQEKVTAAFVRGQFQKSLLVLKDIELVFGKGSLRMLGYLGTLQDPVAQQRIDSMVFQYFDSGDEDEKEHLENLAKGYFEMQRLREDSE